MKKNSLFIRAFVARILAKNNRPSHSAACFLFYIKVGNRITSSSIIAHALHYNGISAWQVGGIKTSLLFAVAASQ